MGAGILRGWELGVDSRGVGAGRRGWKLRDSGVGEKNSLGRKLTLYGGRWERRGGRWETVGWKIGERTPCPPPPLCMSVLA